MAKIILFNSLDFTSQLKALKSLKGKTDLSINHLINQITKINPPVSIYTSGNHRICSSFFRKNTS